jgi:hypothetical protein
MHSTNTSFFYTFLKHIFIINAEVVSLKAHEIYINTTSALILVVVFALFSMLELRTAHFYVSSRIRVSEI